MQPARVEQFGAGKCGGNFGVVPDATKLALVDGARGAIRAARGVYRVRRAVRWLGGADGMHPGVQHDVHKQQQQQPSTQFQATPYRPGPAGLPIVTYQLAESKAGHRLRGPAFIAQRRVAACVRG